MGDYVEFYAHSWISLELNAEMEILISHELIYIFLLAKGNIFWKNLSSKYFCDLSKKVFYIIIKIWSVKKGYICIYVSYILSLLSFDYSISNINIWYRIGYDIIPKEIVNILWKLIWILLTFNSALHTVNT